MASGRSPFGGARTSGRVRFNSVANQREFASELSSRSHSGQSLVRTFDNIQLTEASPPTLDITELDRTLSRTRPRHEKNFYLYDGEEDEDESSSDKQELDEKETMQILERKERGSRSLPGSPRPAMKLGAESDVPLMDLDKDGKEVLEGGHNGTHPQHTSANTAHLDPDSRTAIRREAQEIFRAHSRKRSLWNKVTPKLPTRRSFIDAEGYRHAATAVASDQDPDQVPMRPGVLSSVLAMYGHGTQGEPESISPPTVISSGASTPAGASSGRATPPKNIPKWYSKSDNASTTSLGLLLAKSDVSLPRVDKHTRPEYKRKSSGQNFVSATKHAFLGKPLREHESRIVENIADTLQCQRFLLRICRALMEYGSPTHRLEQNMIELSKRLGIDAQYLYIPGCMVGFFTFTSNARLFPFQMRLHIPQRHISCELAKG